MRIGIQLYSIRKERGLTLKELSYLTDIKDSTISRYEKDKVSPPLNNLEKICKALNIPMEIVLGLNVESGNLGSTALNCAKWVNPWPINYQVMAEHCLKAISVIVDVQKSSINRQIG